MFGVGHTELFVVALVTVILFGNRLPGVMRSLGQSVNEFRYGLHSPDESSSRMETPKPT